MRERSYCYSPSPPRGYGRRGRSPSPRGQHSSQGRDLPTNLLVRNLRRDIVGLAWELDSIIRKRGRRGEGMWRKGGSLQPRELQLQLQEESVERRGFDFVQYVDPADAAEAKYQMDRLILLGRELTVAFANENRKKPAEMRARERVRSRSYNYRSPPRYSHYRYPRSQSP